VLDNDKPNTATVKSGNGPNPSAQDPFVFAAGGLALLTIPLRARQLLPGQPAGDFFRADGGRPAELPLTARDEPTLSRAGPDRRARAWMR